VYSAAILSIFLGNQEKTGIVGNKWSVGCCPGWRLNPGPMGNPTLACVKNGHLNSFPHSHWEAILKLYMEIKVSAFPFSPQRKNGKSILSLIIELAQIFK
jgi:hypothetical protein